ncbi:MAG: polymerase sigma factor [Rhodospirillales bacterium]|jgi:RNA polymerase sigma-70 factor (ECF subfamily)|nr:polymerase sigma factor [Rhodospirillales bacterium]
MAVVSDRDIAAMSPRLRRYATALTGSAADGQDLAQDCLERALTSRDSLRDAERLYPWLLAILHNLHADAHRRQARRGWEEPVDRFADSLALSQAPTDRGAIRDLVRAMAGLTSEHRQVLLLNGLEGLRYGEIAAALEIPIGTVMSRLARAREQLRVALEGEDRDVVRRIR